MENRKPFPVYSSQEVLDFTGECCEKTKHLNGDLVECGVGAGSQIAMMIRHAHGRKVWGFDSFEGIPFATKDDVTQPGIGEIDMSKEGLLQSTGITVHSLENVKDNLQKMGVNPEYPNLVQGWFQNTLPLSSKEIKAISVLRLDGDLYTSTRTSLYWLYEKVVKGGIIIIDDWTLPGSRKAVLEFINLKKIIEIHGIAYTIK